jgi:3-isopropylmalate/(R)-2-methylmalate dehydratase small subunit
MMLEGTIHKFGSDINTDYIIPAKYVAFGNIEELGRHCMEELAPGFSNEVKKGDIIVAERNFGCGSSREQAPMAIVAVGISCVIAKSFARIFYRNSINIGLPVLICPEAVDYAEAGMKARIDLSAGEIEIEGKKFNADPFPEFLQSIIKKGGLVAYVREKLPPEGG